MPALAYIGYDMSSLKYLYTRPKEQTRLCHEPSSKISFESLFFAQLSTLNMFNFLSGIAYHRIIFGGDYQCGKYLASQAASGTSCIPPGALSMAFLITLSFPVASQEEVSGRRLIRCKLGEVGWLHSRR